MEFPTLYTEMTTPSLNSAQFDPHFLKFKVIKCSSFSSAYDPSNILVDCPADQASRWSSESNSPPQYLVLELENSSVLYKIIFGKYEKTHVCNLKKFKIYAGPTEESMAEVLESGLRNDHQKETFRLKNTIDSHYLPVKFVKIVPLQSWGNSFNFSIWYVELHGVDSKDMMEPITQQYDKYREHQAIRLCLKHLRQHNYMEAFEALQKKTKVTLEDPLLDRIHNTLVQNGDYDTVEEIVIGAAKDGLFNHYVNQQDFYARWSRIEPLNRDGSDQRPGQRGGHQMVIDPITETLYLYGGWDGKNELADFWSYHIPTQLWSCISSNTEEDGGPSARSCHKMIIDYERRHLFVLGCYLDAATRSASAAALKSGFYVYDIDQSKWIVITEDTYSMGGPRLLFDHQMCIDMEFQTIYVFGGKVQGCDERSDSHSGLYAYHIPTNHWRKLRGPDDDRNMRSRFGHSMQFNHKTRQLFVYAGQRGKEYINDFFSYDVDTDTVTVLAESNTRCETDTGPPAGFTQRATIDVELGTIHILLGLNRSQKADKDNQCRNVLWLYEIPSKQWSCLSNNPSTASNDTDTADVNSEPSPRYAHQLVYDHIKKIHYMFGGNPGSAQNRSLRLDDFWSLTLCRPSKDYVIRRCKYLMRKHRFKELAGEDAVRALRYLQKDLYETIDHDNKKETAEFQKLTISLFSIDEEITDKGAEDNPRHHKSRSELYSKLVEYFPSSMTQPTENLIDMIPIK